MPEFKINIIVEQRLRATRCFTVTAHDPIAALDIADAALVATTGSITLGGVTYELPDVGRAIHGFDKADGWDCNTVNQTAEAQPGDA